MFTIAISTKTDTEKNFLYVLYSSMDDNIHSAVVPRDKLASKNLLPLFESFQWVCKSKAMANDYVAHCINNFAQKRILYIFRISWLFFCEKQRRKYACSILLQQKSVWDESAETLLPLFHQKSSSQYKRPPSRYKGNLRKVP